MTDLATWQLRGRVRTLRTDIAEWDPERREWRESRHTNDVTFDATGHAIFIESHNPDDHDNPILERSESSSQKGGFDPNGTLRTEMDRRDRHDVQLEYRYDDHGNWVERIVSGRTDESQPFQRTNVEWRTIAYFGTDEVLT